MIRVSIANPQEIHAPPFQRIREVVREVLTGEKIKEAKISVAVVDNPTIHRINKQFLQHDEPTDVVTFPLSAGNARVLEGEIVVGVEVAMAQAMDRGHATDDELLLYVIHGSLHLCGYNDGKPRDRKLMRQKEAEYLRRLAMPPISGDR